MKIIKEKLVIDVDFSEWLETDIVVVQGYVYYLLGKFIFKIFFYIYWVEDSRI